MSAGILRQRITIQEPTVSQDTYGGTVMSWADKFDLWARVVYLNGRELWQAQQAHSEAQGRVAIRYREDISPDMRINHSGSLLEILSIKPSDTKQDRMELLFKEWVS